VYDNNYFNDIYQGIPIGGYNRLTDALLREVEVKTNADFFVDRTYWESLAEKIVFTGKLDEFYGYRFGALEYRTVQFREEEYSVCNYQGCAVVNYTDRNTPYTRIIEHKHFECFGQDIYKTPITIVSKEYSTEWKQGMEPYYPVNDERNNAIVQRYKTLAAAEQNVIFGGRLAEYKYYDMAPIIEQVMSLFDSKK
jgi:UDP-galactopyranose mutase